MQLGQKVKRRKRGRNTNGEVKERGGNRERERGKHRRQGINVVVKGKKEE